MKDMSAATLRKEFLLEPSYISLNHGSFGTVPTPVFNRLVELLREVERNPDLFYRTTLPKLLDESRELLSRFVNADPSDLVFLPNASTGVNSVLKSICFAPNEALLHSTTSYAMVKDVADRLLKSKHVPHVIIAEIVHPLSDQAYVDQLVKAVRDARAKGIKAKVAVVDHISSVPGQIVPLKAAIDALHAEGVAVFVDAAHAAGQTDIDLKALKPDYYTSNLHKWCYMPKGTAFLYVRPDRQQDIYPAVYAYNFTAAKAPLPARFDWMGTVDFTGFLCFPAAMNYANSLGGFPAIAKRLHSLAVDGGCAAADILGTEVMGDSSSFGNMVTVRLPPASIEAYTTLGEELLKRNKFATVFEHGGKYWTRLSAQVYVDLEDFKTVARTMLEILNEK